MSWSFSKSIQRVRDSLWQIMQLVLAALTSYLLAHYGFGHPVPLLSVTVAISSLGFARDTRPGRVATTALAMVIGVAISELLLEIFGEGAWQLGLAILLSLLLARFISPNPAFAVTVSLQAVLVQLLQEPTGGDFTRVIDGVIGGLIALVFTALLPRNPVRLARSDSKQLFEIFVQTLGKVREVLLTADSDTADQALARIRMTQPIVDNWRSSLESAAAIAKVSPFYRWAQKEIADQKALLEGMDRATRHLRVITRRIDYLVKDQKPRPALAPLIGKTIIAVDLLEQSLDDFSLRAKAQKFFTKLIRSLDPGAIGQQLTLNEQVVIMQLRPMLVDLAVASGVDGDAARALLPKVD